MRQYGFSMDDLTPYAVNKILGFELVCRVLGVLPQLWAFKAYFNSSTQSSVRTFSQRRDIHAFIINQKAPKKNWLDKWLWVNRNLVGYGYPWVAVFFDHLPQL